MNPYHNPGEDDAGEESDLLALREIYREAGLSDEHARKSAAADYEHYFGCLAPCAA